MDKPLAVAIRSPTYDSSHGMVVMTIQQEHEQHQHHSQWFCVVQRVEPEERGQHHNVHRGG